MDFRHQSAGEDVTAERLFLSPIYVYFIEYSSRMDIQLI